MHKKVENTINKALQSTSPTFERKMHGSEQICPARRNAVSIVYVCFVLLRLIGNLNLSLYHLIGEEPSIHQNAHQKKKKKK